MRIESDLDSIDSQASHVDVHLLLHGRQILIHLSLLFAEHDRVMAKDTSLFAEGDVCIHIEFPILR